MKSLVVYDSVQGNTERIARSIAAGLGTGAKALRVGAANAGALQDVNLLVVGSPTLGGRPTPAIQAFVAQAAAAPRTAKVAAFDTRLSMKFAKIFGYAAGRIADQLTAAGSTLQSPPEGFIVKGRSGPLAEGETARAEQWGKSLKQ
jgi:flavodoxin